MEFSFVCSNKELKEYTVGNKATVNINGLEARGIVKAIQNNQITLETDNEISNILFERIAGKK